jgi:hypothetical protein
MSDQSVRAKRGKRQMGVETRRPMKKGWKSQPSIDHALHGCQAGAALRKVLWKERDYN